MKILFLIPYVPIPRVVKRIDTAKNYNDVSLIYWNRGTEDMNKAEVVAGINNIAINKTANEGSPFKRVNATLYFLIKAFLLMYKEKPNIVHVTKTDALSIVWFYKTIINRKIKVIYEVSDLHSMALNDSKKFRNRFVKKLLYSSEAVFLKKVDYLLVTSISFWDSYYSKLIEKEKTIYLPNTPDNKVFESYLPKQNGPFTIGFIGKVRYAKQLKMLIDAATQMNVKVLIAGNGIDLEEIKNYTKNNANVKIYGSYNYKEEISNLYNNIDCVYSVYDTSVKNVALALPNRLYEAAICGVPIIAAKNTYLGNVVEKENLGVTIYDGDINGLMESIKFLQSKDLSVYKKNGLDFYNKNNYEHLNQKLIEIYKSTV